MPSRHFRSRETCVPVVLGPSPREMADCPAAGQHDGVDVRSSRMACCPEPFGLYSHWWSRTCERATPPNSCTGKPAAFCAGDEPGPRNHVSRAHSPHLSAQIAPNWQVVAGPPGTVDGGVRPRPSTTFGVAALVRASNPPQVPSRSTSRSSWVTRVHETRIPGRSAGNGAPRALHSTSRTPARSLLAAGSNLAAR